MRNFTIGCFVAIVVIAGCGGSDKKTTPAAGNNTGTTAASGNNQATGDSDYATLVEKASKARIRVTYESSSSGDAAKTLFTLSQDGTGKIAYFSDDGDTQVIADGDTYTSCDNVKTTPKCTQLTGATGKGLISAYTGLFAIPTAAIAAAAKSGAGFGDTSSETIAGRDATCVSLDYLGAGWKTCADKETGILLKWEASAGGAGATFVATEAGPPKDSDFTPPATPETVPSVSVPGYTVPGP
jgi:hypothetical protein